MDMDLIIEKFIYFSQIVAIFTIINLIVYVFLQNSELFFWFCLGNVLTSFVLALFKN